MHKEITMLIFKMIKLHNDQLEISKKPFKDYLLYISDPFQAKTLTYGTDGCKGGSQTSTKGGKYEPRTN
jgi:hypothetical protein